MEKNWISTSFSLEKLRFPLENTNSDVKYSLPRENLVFDVKTSIFLTKRFFLMEKSGIWKFFSRKTEVSTVNTVSDVKYTFPRENLVFGVKLVFF